MYGTADKTAYVGACVVIGAVVVVNETAVDSGMFVLDAEVVIWRLVVLDDSGRHW